MAIDLTNTHAIFLILGSIIITLGSFLFFYLVNRVLVGIAIRAGANKSLARTIREVMVLIWLVLAVTSVAAFTGLASLFTTLTISGIVGLTISLALQSTISNIIAGWFLFSDGVVRLGDMIECGGIKGTVIRTALRNTWIRKEDGKIAIIGNSTLASGPLLNHSATERLNKKIETG